MRCGLASDATVDVGLAGKIFVEVPQFGDGVAEEDDAVLAERRRFEGGVGGAIAAEFAEIVAQRSRLRFAVSL